MKSSDLSHFSELSALEIRGIDKKFKFIIDVPLNNVNFANFESLELAGDEKTSRRPRNTVVDPAESFTYTPTMEANNEYNVTLEVEDEAEVLPYEQYLLEVQKTKLPSFFGWESLLTLRVHNCHLEQLDWEVFDGLNNLLHLSLDHNHIKVIPYFAFYGTPNLQFLSIAHNEILNLNYRDLAGLLNLKILDLSHNNLTRISEMTFPPFPKLEVLDLRHNSISQIFSHTFDVMNMTETLFLGTPGISIDFTQSDEAFDLLSNLKHLTILNASHPRFNEKLFRGLDKLEVLKMKGSFQEITYDAFGSVSNLRELIISECRIESLSMDAFYSNEMLEIVDLSNNQLAYLPPNLFDRQLRLRELYLQNNFLTDLTSSFFQTTAAKIVRLINNPWICTCGMASWNQGVTNKHISKAKPECDPIINDSLFDDANFTGFCGDKPLYNYAYDNKLSPRCDGGPDHVKHRSVYYALRRDLKCKSEPKIRKRTTLIKIADQFVPKKLTVMEALIKQRQSIKRILQNGGRQKFQRPISSTVVDTRRKQKQTIFEEDDGNMMSNDLLGM